MPTGLGSRPTFSCSHPRSSRYISSNKLQRRYTGNVPSLASRLSCPSPLLGAFLRPQEIHKSHSCAILPKALDFASFSLYWITAWGTSGFVRVEPFLSTGGCHEKVVLRNLRVVALPGSDLDGLGTGGDHRWDSARRRGGRKGRDRAGRPRRNQKHPYKL